ncbi:DUF1453 family protein [Labedaea rhizosphaerae]|uniref:Uncharacterized protein DUF1453 n=1 Tax=Labedaea rhizosphaerae TaxID=598644 RepID=A0A4R6SP13_LABRH|nr:DUF1453 family protein [Labedaea rhizosphaerae]TDQ05192.1 uncharacterized protein DUF1453 [Labedaea rhizosphaerae]
MKDALQFGGLFLGIVLFTQIGTRRHNLFWTVMPFVTSGSIGAFVILTGQHHYQLPGDVWSGVVGGLIGVAIGLTLTTVMRVFRRDGRLYVRSAWAYLAIWFGVLAARTVFVWLLENVPSFATSVGKFMLRNGIGPDGATLFFVLMALAMSVSRELGVLYKAHRLSPEPERVSA